MKHSFFILAFFVVNLAVVAQTTNTDYLYLTVGYPDDLNKGKPLLSEYYLDLVGNTSSITNENGIKIVRTVKCQAFTLKENKEVRAYLFTFKREDTGYTDYFCVPVATSEESLRTKAANDFFEKNNKAGYPTSATSYLWATINMIASNNSFNSKQ